MALEISDSSLSFVSMEDLIAGNDRMSAGESAPVRCVLLNDRDAECSDRGEYLIYTKRHF
jgi:hypothetical protein